MLKVLCFFDPSNVWSLRFYTQLNVYSVHLIRISSFLCSIFHSKLRKADGIFRITTKMYLKKVPYLLQY